MKRHRTSQESLERDKRHAASITRVLSIYGYITDSYIIEFFTDHLWESLPESWRVVLSDLPAPQLADQLLCNGNSAEVRYSSVWPLSLLALKVTAHSLAFQRTPRYEKISGLQKRPAEFQHNHSQSSRLDPLFRKHVKPKKQHEIRQLGKLVKKLCDSTSCADVVDVGSGQNGGTEATSIPFPKPPRHVLACVDPQAPWEDFVRQVASNAEETSLQSAGENKMADDTWRTLTNASTSHVTTSTEEVMNLKTTRENEAAEPSAGSCHVVSESRVDRRFLLTGLHACGDLSVAMLRHFARCPGVAGITSVACCYMKLTTLEVPQPPGVLSADSDIREFGYPMSSWVSRLSGHKLSYKSREVACHAIEDYIARLKGDSDILRTHCYRAMLETVIRKVDPTMRRPGVQTIKKAHRLPFTEYAMLGLERVGLDPNTPLDETSVEHMLSQQQNVVVFFSLALLLAPLVETLILLDRMIFLRERGFQCEVIPLFKPQFSARNLVLVAAKDISDLGDLLEETTASESAM
ncbi:protein RRNAD1 isoform X2 [Rana temporaria]|uniref:protein RRNAD1 isoform X2 n=1 Tax=Rana temporaria TaxID=8407 RepID=UPI001AACE283|nr:protein RRNAD1 isoform X2 [Rana temporaria]